MNLCPDCDHPPIRHVPDGSRATCLVCLFMFHERLRDAAEGRIHQTTILPHICSTKFTFRLSQREREQAIAADKESWPPHTVCIALTDGIECGCEWQQHMGYLCPSGDSTFLPLIETDPGLGIVEDA